MGPKLLDVLKKALLAAQSEKKSSHQLGIAEVGQVVRARSLAITKLEEAIFWTREAERITAS